MPDEKQPHPYGTTLLSRDNKANRDLFPHQTVFGHIPVASTICPNDDQCPYYHYNDDYVKLDRQKNIYKYGTELSEDGGAADETPIHILIAAYRDRLCGRTLHNAFTKAKNPKRIFIRVIDQTDPTSDLADDAGCWETYCHEYNENCETEYKNQVKIVHIDSHLSRGPTFARSKLSAMVHYDYMNSGQDFVNVERQDFCMQIDSHMDFSDNWDVGLVAMFHRTENDYAVLSTYVADIVQNNKDPSMVPNLCMVQFTSSIRNWGTKECANLIKPKLTNAMWGAGLSFHRCHAELVVPVDPYLDNVFDGEEGSRGIRFFTHGYDVYSPDKVLVTHDYHTHQGNPVVHTWGRGKKQDDAEHQNDSLTWKWNEDIENSRQNWHTFGSKRVNMLLGIGSKFDSTPQEKEEVDRIRASRFGLGIKRTLQQAVEFTGINLLEEKMVDNKCGNLLWVPFEESPKYSIVEEVLARPYDGIVPINEGKKESDNKPAAAAVAAANNNNQADLHPAAPVGGELGGASPQLRSLGQNVPGSNNGTIKTAKMAIMNDSGSRNMITVGLLIVLAALIMKILVSMGWRNKDERHKR